MRLNQNMRLKTHTYNTHTNWTATLGTMMEPHKNWFNIIIPTGLLPKLI